MEELIAKIWSFIGLFTLLQNILPQPLHQILMQWLSSIEDYFHPYFHPHYYHLEILEYKDSLAVNANELYYNIEHYIESLDGITHT
ncbi:hypothetical protein SUGI_0687450 [Cryptomeria japonica]|nr:hypothetical protein SUGI_0687450 [Cryptomeria japonica]